MDIHRFEKLSWSDDVLLSPKSLEFLSFDLDPGVVHISKPVGLGVVPMNELSTLLSTSSI